MRQLIDRPHTSHCKALDRMILEFSKYLSEMEMDICLEFLEKIQDSKYDVNWSEEDAKTQMQLMLGSDRYLELKRLWGKDNQHLLKNLGSKKYLGKDGVYYDGLDPTDNIEDFKEVYI
ncbi:hypothetical protein UFOVP623_7 [uncultured Caudovirales phage]|uniref:Uncharacterized protein n=1 Tax=uncultured Caudovirales phage TaxID=2100421 RepID=A0A6J5N5P6_9CAUD|nr:hypothetical protein UFOVP623_7 [uncultured Caudovirales phage]